MASLLSTKKGWTTYERSNASLQWHSAVMFYIRLFLDSLDTRVIPTRYRHVQLFFWPYLHYFYRKQTFESSQQFENSKKACRKLDFQTTLQSLQSFSYKPGVRQKCRAFMVTCVKWWKLEDWSSNVFRPLRPQNLLRIVLLPAKKSCRNSWGNL